MMSPWVESWEYRIRMFVSIFDEPPNYFATLHNDSLSLENGMLAMKEIYVFTLGDIKEPTNVLLGLFVKSIHHCGLM